MGSSRVEQALNELDPGSRAVVDLSLGTDFSDENIATLIRVEPDEVARRRDRAIDALQQKLGGASHDDVVMELCAAMGVEPSPAMLEGTARNGSAATPAATSNGVAETADEPETHEPEASAPQPESLEPAHGTESQEPLAEDPEIEDAREAADESHVDPAPLPEAEPAAAASVDTADPGVDREPETEAESVSRAELRPDVEPPPSHEPETRDHGAGRAQIPPPPPLRRERETSGAPAPRRRVGALLAALAAVAILIVGIVALSSGGAGSDPGSVEPQNPASEQPTEPGSGSDREVSATLEALPDAPAGAQASVDLEGDVLTVELDGLPAPEGTYEAWLFNSVLDSRPLGSTGDGSGTIRAELPDSADRYEYVDIAIQPASDAQHSGQSIFRVPVADLLG